MIFTGRYSVVYVLIFLIISCTKEPQEVDILIVGGLVYDGLNSHPSNSQIAIKDDRIEWIGKEIGSFVAKDTIPAYGMIVAPGFIDPHTHAGGDLDDTLRNSNINYLLQGVTTVFVGNDGRSYSNLIPLFEKWQNQGIGTNAASYIGHSTVRRQVMGMRDTLATLEELDNMRLLVKRGMEAGAIGLSSGLFYPPASYSNTEEVIALAREASAFGGIYDVHMRDESSYNVGLIGSVEETIRIAEEANIPGHIAHIKCLGADVWGQSLAVIQMIENARNSGIRITADQYPYIASGTSIAGALIPRWVFTDGNADEKFNDVRLRDQIKNEMADNLRRRGGPASILFTAPSSKNEDILGLTLDDVAQSNGVDPVEAAIEVFLKGGSSVASFNMNEGDVRNFMQQPWVMTGSDGSTGHPRKYGSFPRKIRNYVLEEKVLTMSEMINRSTALPAETFKIAERGMLSPGYFADIIVFNPNQIRDIASFEKPYELSVGVSYVMVNGQVTVENGVYTGALSGKVLRRINQQLQ